MSISYRNAKYINDSGWVDCEINHPTYGWIPYTMDPNDGDMTINNAELIAAMSINGDVKPYNKNDPESIASASEDARSRRDAILINEVDPIASNGLRWAELSDDKKAAFAEYRKLLLDIPEQSGFPYEIVWPTKPNL